MQPVLSSNAPLSPLYNFGKTMATENQRRQASCEVFRLLHVLGNMFHISARFKSGSVTYSTCVERQQEYVGTIKGGVVTFSHWTAILDGGTVWNYLGHHMTLLTSSALFPYSRWVRGQKILRDLGFMDLT